ncbi:hypothetical protein DSO57_1016910 [Entomophthora muscae]|uniref:Uncharacterized protein n=1 Tax=Entomophthora muscae TaxID=34485 RepID=A0ACC2U311_9FUNG|nr:hypothetical protein DSO57_1016910 [Entomophthora muscae]
MTTKISWIPLTSFLSSFNIRIMETRSSKNKKQSGSTAFSKKDTNKRTNKPNPASKSAELDTKVINSSLSNRRAEPHPDKSTKKAPKNSGVSKATTTVETPIKTEKSLNSLAERPKRNVGKIQKGLQKKEAGESNSAAKKPSNTLAPKKDESLNPDNLSDISLRNSVTGRSSSPIETPRTRRSLRKQSDTTPNRHENALRYKSPPKSSHNKKRQPVLKTKTFEVKSNDRNISPKRQTPKEVQEKSPDSTSIKSSPVSDSKPSGITPAKVKPKGTSVSKRKLSNSSDFNSSQADEKTAQTPIKKRRGLNSLSSSNSDSEYSRGPSMLQSPKRMVKASRLSNPSLDPEERPGRAVEREAVVVLSPGHPSPNLLHWDEFVDRVITIRSNLSKNYTVFILWADGKCTAHCMDEVKLKCPQKLIQFFQNHITASV